MERSGSQKILLVLSIINIIAAVVALLGGLLVMLGGAAVGTVPASDAAAALEGTGVTQGGAGARVGVAGLVIVLGGVIGLVVGILGVRAANDNQKIMPVWVLAIVQLVLYAISLISTIAGGSFGTQGASAIVSLVVAFLIVWLANNIKKEAGR